MLNDGVPLQMNYFGSLRRLARATARRGLPFGRKALVCEPAMREYHRRIVRFLQDQGCGGVTIVHESRHPRVVFSRNGREYRHPVAGSPRCEYRAVRNIITQLKRLIKKDAAPVNLACTPGGDD